MPYAMGVDIGTSSIKVGMLNLTSLHLEHLASNTLPGDSEIAADFLWLQTWQTIKAAVEMLDGKETVTAIGIAGQMHGAVLYDEKGQVIDPILTWQDKARCSPEILYDVKAISAKVGSQDLGTEMACGYTGAILLWLKGHDPHLFQRIARFGLIPDFIRGKLLGRPDHCTDPTNAFGTGLFNVSGNRWHQGLIAALGLDTRIFPDVRDSESVAGTLTRPLAEELGLPEIPVVYGGGDNQVGMLGSGLDSSDSPVLVNIGTAAQISKVVAEYIYHPGIDTRSYFDNQFALVGAGLGGGGSYQWLRAEIGRQQGHPISYAEMDRLAAQVAPGADGLKFCPGPSRQEPNRRRGFSGNMAYLEDIGHQARAVMEGVLMDLYEHYSVLQQYDRNDALIGGGKGLIASKVWQQIAAEIFGRPIRVAAPENVVLGAALLAARGAGYH